MPNPAAPDPIPFPVAGGAAPLALTMGEPAGVGGEIALMAWLARERDHLPPFFIIDDPARLAALARCLALAVPLREISEPEAARAVFRSALPVLAQPLPRPGEPGRPDPANADAVRRSIERAVELVQAKRVSGIVTNPIHKATLYKAGLTFPGHTEYLASL